jgi:hypothetical protein
MVRQKSAWVKLSNIKVYWDGSEIWGRMAMIDKE